MTTKYRLTNSKINELERLASERLAELFSVLGINLRQGKKYYVGSCPIHCGDNDSAFVLYHSGHSIVGNWKCFTHNCQETFKSTLLGFIRGVLSRTRYGWVEPGDEICPFEEALSFLSEFCNKDLDSIIVDYEDIDKKRFISQIHKIYYREENGNSPLNIERKILRKSLIYPCEYFLHRDFSSAILDRYDVGFCNQPGKQMYKRAVVPVYDINHKYIIGCCGRSIFDKCAICEMYHDPTHKCPSKEDKWIYRKWKNNKGFPGDNVLYNYWFSKEHIRKEKIIAICEGPGDIWRLEEAQIKIGVATLGAHLTDSQRSIIDKSGAMAIIILTDPDHAGNLISKVITDEMGSLYSIYRPILVSDIGSMTVEAIQRLLVPLIRQIKQELYLDD